jgi:hypothetical protein
MPRHLLPVAVAATALLLPVPAAAAVPVLDVDASGAIGAKRKAEARLTVPGGFAGRIGIERRGSTSAAFPKRSFSFETRGARGKEGRAVSLLGLPAHPDWVLDAAYLDRSRLRAAVGYELARRLTGRWAPRTRHVELRLDGRAAGLYVLTERLARGAKRAGSGALVELSEPRDAGDFRLPRSRAAAAFHDPERGKLSERQEAAVRRAVQGAERALAAGRGWRARLDEASAVDHLLLQELLGNVDAFKRSTYLVVPARGAKVRLGPVWDLDRTLGLDPAGWRSAGRPLARHLLADAGFRSRLAARWAQWRPGLEARIDGIVAGLDAPLADARARDLAQWPRPGGTQEQEMAALGAWARQRIAWLDAQLRR